MSLLGALGGLVGFAMGGPAGAAVGSGIGSLAGGGDIGDALQSAVMGFAGAGSGGIASLLSGAMGQQGAAAGASNPLAMLSSAMTGGNIAARKAAQGQMGNMVKRKAMQGLRGGGGGLTDLFNLGPQGQSILNNPLIQAIALQAMEPREVKITTPLQDRQIATGERRPDYRGTQAMDVRRMAQGGLIKGPGTGTSDSIPAQIYQNGMPVQEAALSTDEFVLRKKDVDALGGGSNGAGAARLYALQRRIDQGGMMPS